MRNLNIEELKQKLIQYLQQHHPYPEDIFRDLVGKTARTGYNSCMYNVQKFFDEILENVTDEVNLDEFINQLTNNANPYRLGLLDKARKKTQEECEKLK